MTIVNEQFIISNVSHEQFKTYFSEKPTAQIPSSTVSQPESTALAPSVQNKEIPPELVGLNEQQVLMVQEFSAKSRLNLEWSKQ
jgi:hypothetical protein